MITAIDLKPRAPRLFDSTDVDETRDLISAVMQPHELEPVGRPHRLRAHMDFLDVGGLGLGSIGFGAMRVRLPQLADYHLVILCHRGSAVLRSGGQELTLDQRRGAWLPPGAALDAEFSADCEQFVLRIPEGLFQRHTGQRRQALRQTIDLERPEWQSWARVLCALGDYPEPALQHAKIAADYQALLLGLMVKAGAPARRDAGAVAPHSVKRAEAFIRENAAGPLLLEDIARAAEVPVRTLLSSFRRFRQTTPMSYLRDVRLDRVRARLSAAGPQECVTSIALEEGFSHLGRFAQEYASRFGERPSETLRAAAGR